MSIEKKSLKSVIGIMRTSNLLSKNLKKTIKKYDLNMTEFAVLEILYNKGKQPIQHISQKILIASSSTTYIIDKLVEKKLVKKKINSDDKRIIYCILTDNGKKLMDILFPEHVENVKEFFSILSEEEIDNILISLKKLNDK